MRNLRNPSIVTIGTMKTVKTFFFAFPVLNSTGNDKKLKHSNSYPIINNFHKMKIPKTERQRSLMKLKQKPKMRPYEKFCTVFCSFLNSSVFLHFLCYLAQEMTKKLNCSKPANSRLRSPYPSFVIGFIYKMRLT